MFTSKVAQSGHPKVNKTNKKLAAKKSCLLSSCWMSDSQAFLLDANSSAICALQGKKHLLLFWHQIIS